jgi:alpha-1,2-glucosyltransferase
MPHKSQPKVNKGITLGDRAAHTPVTHLPQILYFALFTALLSFPLFLLPLLRTARLSLKSPALAVVGAIAFGTAAACAVVNFTLIHPYLLADNRHYTFYIWRRLIARHWSVR